jgi:putative ABC transport system substrate-binding protein
MQRRDFIKVIAGSAAAWPFAAHSQQPTPVVGFLSSRSPGESAPFVDAFRQGLKEVGYLEGKDVHISFRWAEGRYDRLTQLANELVEAQVAVIASVGGLVAALAAKSATRTIPIVAVTSDPLKHGLVASFNRPGGNITAVSPSNTALSSKRMELLRELVPTATAVGVLVNPINPDSASQLEDTKEAARTFGQQIRVVNASSERDIDAAFASLAEHRIGVLLATLDPFFDTRREQIVAQAAHYAVPTIYGQRAYPVAGGLMSYASSFVEAYRQAGIYAGRILKGDKPADLPVVQPTKFELVINLKTAKTLGLTIPAKLLALADEVIE